MTGRGLWNATVFSIWLWFGISCLWISVTRR